ncbi:hypothetical protein B7P43_G17113 [Cryptotermes secundus]|uniref:PiggyBac transposable element-derived protein domain-containing protein n=1 Tax=Cryptotermes secundus TaxID=105785 RepID=A0A2J7RIV3_9NEOP|nr:hypothetical protein B7P43_G17113 [Cryptotermes secundus]
MAQRQKQLRSLGGQEILDIFSDELSDLPTASSPDSEAIISDSDSDGDHRAAQNVSSESESSVESASVGTATWDKVDKTPTLGKFTGDPGVKQMPSDPTDVSEVASLFFGDSFFDLLCQETNRYCLQHREAYDRTNKVLKWVDVTSTEMKIFLAIIILMGLTKRENLKDYWSSDPFLEIAIFGKLMSRKRFEQIWWCLHFNNNEVQPQPTGRLFKIQPLLDILVEKFQTVYKPEQQLSLDESVIPWRGRLRIRTYNPGKLTKYGLLVRVVTESTSGCIGNLDMYSAEGKKLQETLFSVLGPYLDQNYHVYQDNYYNSVATAEYLLSRKVRICGTIRVNRGLPPDLKEECEQKFYFEIQSILLKLAKAWATDVTVAAVPTSDTDVVQLGPSVRTCRRPQVDPPGRLSGDMQKLILVKIVKSEYCKKKHPSRQCRVCAEHKKTSRTAYMYNFCVIPLHKESHNSHGLAHSTLSLGSAGTRRTVYYTGEDNSATGQESFSKEQDVTFDNVTAPEAPCPSTPQDSRSFLVYNRISTVIGGVDESSQVTTQGPPSPSQGSLAPTTNTAEESKRSTKTKGKGENSIWYEYGCV